jgi:Fe-S cluster assembly iron-binding protein IscA
VLTVTAGAATLIRALNLNAGGSHGSGLRIVIDPVHESLSMSLASRPAPSDTVVVSFDTRVFLSSDASQRLASRTLQAHTTPTRSSFFFSP